MTARTYGFASWAKLRQHLSDIEPLIWNTPPPPDPTSREEVFLRLACLTYAGWHRSSPARALRMLADDPALARAAGKTLVDRALAHGWSDFADLLREYGGSPSRGGSG